MKNLLVVVLLFCGSVLFGQDQIILRSGETLSAKVLEISSQEIKYKRFDHLDGPTVVLEKNKVFMINYENGTNEVIRSLEETENPGSNQQTSISPPTNETAPTSSNQESVEPTNSYENKSSSATVNESYTNNHRKVYTTYEEDDFLLHGGLVIPFFGSYNVGVGLGLERAWYFSPNVGLTGSLSATINSLNNSVSDLNGTMITANSLVGLQARSRGIGTQGYGMILIGATWKSFSGNFEDPFYSFDLEGSVWTWTLGGGGGVVINDQIDLGLRIYHDIDFGETIMQIGAGIHF